MASEERVTSQSARITSVLVTSHIPCHSLYNLRILKYVWFFLFSLSGRYNSLRDEAALQTTRSMQAVALHKDYDTQLESLDSWLQDIEAKRASINRMERLKDRNAALEVFVFCL